MKQILFLSNLACFLLLVGPATSVAQKVAEITEPGDFGDAQRAIQKNQFARAAASFALFSKKNPREARAPLAYLEEGVCQLKGGKSDEALRCWKTIVEYYSASAQVPDALEHLIPLYQGRNSVKEADQLAQRLIKEFPRHAATSRYVRTIVVRADAAMAKQRYEEVIRELTPLKELLPASGRQSLDQATALLEARIDPSKLLTAAGAALRVNEPAKAAPLLEAFLARSDVTARQTEAKVKLGWAYYCLNADEKARPRARALWEEVIRKGPPADEWVGESQWHMVQLLAGPLGQWKEAVDRCEKVTKTVIPGTFRHEQALFTRAWLLWVHKQWEPAKGAFNDLVRVYPQKATHPPIIAYLAECDKNLSAKPQP